MPMTPLPPRRPSRTLSPATTRPRAVLHPEVNPPLSLLAHRTNSSPVAVRPPEPFNMEMMAQQKVAAREAAAQAIIDEEETRKRWKENEAQLRHEMARRDMEEHNQAVAKAKAEAAAARAATVARIEAVHRAKAAADAVLYRDRQRTKVSTYRRPSDDQNSGYQLMQWITVASGRLATSPESGSSRPPLSDIHPEDQWIEDLVHAIVNCRPRARAE